MNAPSHQGRGFTRRSTLLAILFAGLLGGSLGLGIFWPDGVRAVARELADPIVIRRVEGFAPAIRFAAKESDLDPNLLAGLVYSESSGNVGAVSKAGAMGLMQLVPAAASDSAKRLGVPKPTKKQLLEDADLNLRLGASHFAWTLKHEERDPLRALVAYNAGRTKLRRWIRKAGSYEAWLAKQRRDGDSTTLAYADRVLSYAETFRERGNVATAPSE